MKHRSNLNSFARQLRWTTTCWAILLASGAIRLHGNEIPSYFPLQVGNHWVLESTADPSKLIKIEVVRTRMWNDRAYFLVSGYASKVLWLRYADDARILAWEPEANRETSLTTLSSEASEYTTTLGGCEQTARPLPSPTGGGNDSSLLPRQIDYVPCPDGGLIQEVYRPGFGLIQRTVWTPQGQESYRMVSASIGGKTLGLRNRGLVFHSNFRNSAENWLSGFSGYSLEEPNPLGSAELRTVPTESADERQAMYLQSTNSSGSMFMFVKKIFTLHDGIEPGGSYRLSVGVRIFSGAPSGCGGVGDSVYLKAGASPYEPVPIFSSDKTLKLNVDKGNASSGGVDAGILGTISTGEPCLAEPARVWRSLQRSYSHPVPVVANSRGELWLWIGTDSEYPGLTSLYLESITFRLTPEL